MSLGLKIKVWNFTKFSLALEPHYHVLNELESRNDDVVPCAIVIKDGTDEPDIYAVINLMLEINNIVDNLGGDISNIPIYKTVDGKSFEVILSTVQSHYASRPEWMSRVNH